MKEKNISTYTLRNHYKISPDIIYRMKRNQDIKASTIDRFCKILDCEVEDIIKCYFINEDEKTTT